MDARTDEPVSAPVSNETAEPEAASEPVSLETAASWLAAARPTSVLALLRDPDFAFISMTAFAGFRVNTSGYALPLVRKRLAQEISRNTLFAEKIRALAEEVQDRPPAPPSGDDRRSKPAPATPEMGAGGQSAGPSRREQEMKAERDRRRQERDEARDALSRSEVERAQAEAARAVADGARAEQSKVVQQQAQRIVRLERQVARMQAERMSLLKALRQDKDAPPPPPPPGHHPGTRREFHTDVRCVRLGRGRVPPTEQEPTRDGHVAGAGCAAGRHRESGRPRHRRPRL